MIRYVEIKLIEIKANYMVRRRAVHWAYRERQPWVGYEVLGYEDGWLILCPAV